MVIANMKKEKVHEKQEKAKIGHRDEQYKQKEKCAKLIEKHNKIEDKI